MTGTHVNILVVTHFFWPESFRINDLTTGLQQLGRRVEVLNGMPNYPGEGLFSGYDWFKLARDDFNGIRVVRVPLIARMRGKWIAASP